MQNIDASHGLDRVTRLAALDRAVETRGATWTTRQLVDDAEAFYRFLTGQGEG